MIPNLFERVKRFDWDEANIGHIARHKVTPEEAEDIFFDEDHIIKDDLKHSSVEKRFVIMGKTRKNRVLYQIFTKRKNSLRVISSRDINAKEVKLYEKETRSSKI